jgi:hypothetical protein
MEIVLIESGAAQIILIQSGAAKIILIESGAAQITVDFITAPKLISINQRL